MYKQPANTATRSWVCAETAVAGPPAARLQVNWICQQQPSPEVVARIAAAGLHVRLFIDPPQVSCMGAGRGLLCAMLHAAWSVAGVLLAVGFGLVAALQTGCFIGVP